MRESVLYCHRNSGDKNFISINIYLIVFDKILPFFAKVLSNNNKKPHNICKFLRLMPVLVSRINSITHLPLEIILKLFY